MAKQNRIEDFGKISQIITQIEEASDLLCIDDLDIDDFVRIYMHDDAKLEELYVDMTFLFRKLRSIKNLAEGTPQ